MTTKFGTKLATTLRTGWIIHEAGEAKASGPGQQAPKFLERKNLRSSKLKLLLILHTQFNFFLLASLADYLYFHFKITSAAYVCFYCLSQKITVQIRLN